MPYPLDLAQSPFDTHLPHRVAKGDGAGERRDFVLGAMDQEGRCRVGAPAEVEERGNGGDEVGGGRAGPGFAVAGTDAVEEEGEAVAFFEEGEDELGAGVAGAQPA